MRRHEEVNILVKSSQPLQLELQLEPKASKRRTFGMPVGNRTLCTSPLPLVGDHVSRTEAASTFTSHMKCSPAGSIPPPLFTASVTASRSTQPCPPRSVHRLVYGQHTTADRQGPTTSASRTRRMATDGWSPSTTSTLVYAIIPPLPPMPW